MADRNRFGINLDRSELNLNYKKASTEESNKKYIDTLESHQQVLNLLDGLRLKIARATNDKEKDMLMSQYESEYWKLRRSIAKERFLWEYDGGDRLNRRAAFEAAIDEEMDRLNPSRLVGRHHN